MDKKRILIVEDDESLREIYVELLAGEGYAVDSAKDGYEALEKLKWGGWDLVLMDIVLPKMDGFQVVKEARKILPKIPAKCIVFNTNLYADAQIKEALSLGMGYLIKSQLSPDELINKVKIFINDKKQA